MVLWLRAGFRGATVVWPWLPPRTGWLGSMGTVWAKAAGVASSVAASRNKCFIGGEV